jgi:hypothetical protein
MKQIRNLINGLVAGGLALAMVSTLAAQTPEQVNATVVRIKGSARYTTGNNVWQPLKVGSTVRPGTVIQTGMDPGTYVDLVLGTGPANEVSPVLFNPAAPSPGGFSASAPPMSYGSRANQNVVRLMENTLLGIDRLTSLQTGAEEVTDTELDLKAGRVLGNVKKLSSASKYEVKLPTGVAGIRGTFYDASIDWVKCLIGSITYAWIDANNNAQTGTITGGQKIDTRLGQISPLSNEDNNSMQATMNGMRPQGGGTVTLQIGPPNIEHVSPNRGNEQGNNNGQGNQP